MKQLVLKDLRAHREIIILGLVMLLLPVLAQFVLGATVASYSGVELISRALYYGAKTSTVLTMLVTLMLTGFIVAGERRSGTAFFMATLPPDRKEILLGKSIVCLGWIALLWSFEVLVVDVVVASLDVGEISESGLPRYAMQFYVLAVFGITWFASCSLESPIYSMLLGFLLPSLLSFATMMILFKLGYEVEGTALSTNLLKWQNFVLFAAGFAGGWIAFLRRTEP